MQESLNQIQFKPDLIVFDLDGTLYNQAKLRTLLMRRLLFRLITFRTTILDFRIISCFRNQREKKKGYSSGRLAEEQFEWCAKILKLPVRHIRNSVETYMYKFPLPFLKRFKYKGIDEFFDMLRKKNIRIVIYSDYPVENKLKALELAADAMHCSTDDTINQFKPSLKALRLICTEMKCDPKKTLCIGDREETDGEGARLAGIPFVLLDPEKAGDGSFYTKLAEQINPAYGKI